VHFFVDRYHRVTYRMVRPGKLKLVTNVDFGEFQEVAEGR
jgi:hypothetical protein